MNGISLFVFFVVCIFAQDSSATLSTSSQILQRLLDRVSREGSATNVNDRNVRRDNLEIALIDEVAQELERRQTSVDEIIGDITCSADNEQLIDEFFLEPEAHLECVYGYQLNDWLETFAEIQNNPGPGRSTDFVELMNCLGAMLVPLITNERDSRGGDLTIIPDSCSVWTGRYAYSNSGHPYAGCDAILQDEGFTTEVLQSYVTAGNACIMHKDMELLEGIVSAVGAQGPLGMLVGVPPVELCAFSYLKQDARWFRVNEPTNVGDCTYRLEQRKRQFADDSVNSLLSRLLKGALGKRDGVVA